MTEVSTSFLEKKVNIFISSLVKFGHLLRRTGQAALVSP